MKVSFTFSRFTGPTRITVLDEQGVPLRCSLKENISKCALKDEGECMGLWERVPLSALAYTVVHSPQLGAQPPVHALSNQTSSPILIRSQLDQAGCLRNHLGNHYGTFWGPPFIASATLSTNLPAWSLSPSWIYIGDLGHIWPFVKSFPLRCRRSSYNHSTHIRWIFLHPNQNADHRS